jgi:hypothetical protein
MRRAVKTISIVIIAAFFLIAVLPGILEIKSGFSRAARGGTSYENRAATIKNAIYYKLFKTSGNSQVIAGKDGWLYYAPTVNDFTGAGTLSDDEIKQIADSFSRVNRLCEEHGAKLTVIIAPNKNEVYPEHMPDTFKKSEKETNLDKLLNALSGAGIDAPDMRKMLCVEPDLYYKTDTHWNAKGAAIAADHIIEKYAPETEYRYSGEVAGSRDGFKGDLYGLLFPDRKTDEKELSDKTYLFNGKPAYRYVEQPASMMDIEIETEGIDAGGGKLLVYRDSFGSELIPLLSGSFEYARYLRSNMPYELEFIKTDEPDAVVFVIAQRNIPTLLTGSLDVNDIKG